MPALHTSVVGVVGRLTDAEIEDRFGALIEEFEAAILQDVMMLVEIDEPPPEPEPPPKTIVPKSPGLTQCAAAARIRRRLAHQDDPAGSPQHQRLMLQRAA